MPREPGLGPLAEEARPAPAGEDDDPDAAGGRGGGTPLHRAAQGDHEDITNALALFARERPDMVMSCCDARKNPYFNLVENCTHRNSGIINQDIQCFRVSPGYKIDTSEFYDKIRIQGIDFKGFLHLMDGIIITRFSRL